jgi:DNA-binding transcriptional ArsR family regulator
MNLFKALSNPDRITILKILKDSKLNVSQIGESTNIKQPNLSQQLTVLRKSNLVNTYRSGKEIYYSIKNEAVFEIIDIAEKF